MTLRTWLLQTSAVRVSGTERIISPVSVRFSWQLHPNVFEYVNSVDENI